MSAVDPGGCSSAPSTRDCELIMSVSAESAPSCSSSLLGCQESSLSRKAIQVLRAASHPALRAAAGPWLGSSLTTRTGIGWSRPAARSEEHTSELQSRGHLVCRLLLEKKKKTRI